MALPEPKGHRIPLSEAAEQTKRYRDSRHSAGLFLREELDALLAQPECRGLRFYYGRNRDAMDTVILVGVDKNGNDLADGVLMDVHYPCPPICSDDNALNS